MEFVKNLLYMSLEFTKNVAVSFSRHRPKEEGINHLLLVSLYWGVGGGAISYNGEKCGPQYVFTFYLQMCGSIIFWHCFNSLMELYLLSSHRSELDPPNLSV